jgi:hypothetical protein
MYGYLKNETALPEISLAEKDTFARSLQHDDLTN